MIWISVKERLPDENQWAWAKEGEICVPATWHEGHFFTIHRGVYSILDATHWQPLPEPPKSSSANTSPSVLADRGNSLPPQSGPIFAEELWAFLKRRAAKELENRYQYAEC